MVNLELLPIATAQAKKESRNRRNIIFYVFWDGVDEYGIVPEDNEMKFMEMYPKAFVVAKFLNGEKVG